MPLKLRLLLLFLLLSQGLSLVTAQQQKARSLALSEMRTNRSTTEKERVCMLRESKLPSWCVRCYTGGHVAYLLCALLAMLLFFPAATYVIFCRE